MIWVLPDYDHLDRCKGRVVERIEDLFRWRKDSLAVPLCRNMLNNTLEVRLAHLARECSSPAGLGEMRNHIIDVARTRRGNLSGGGRGGSGGGLRVLVHHHLQWTYSQVRRQKAVQLQNQRVVRADRERALSAFYNFLRVDAP